MAKGRPVEPTTESQPRQFTREYKYSDGVTSKWHYDLDRSPNGPIEVELSYPEDWDKKEKTDKKQYLNPTTGRYISKSRAKQLGII